MASCRNVFKMSHHLIGWLVSRSVGQSIRPIEIAECRSGSTCNYHATDREFTNRPRTSINQNNSARSLIHLYTIHHYPLFTVSVGYIVSSARGNDHFLFKKLVQRITFFM